MLGYRPALPCSCLVFFILVCVCVSFSRVATQIGMSLCCSPSTSVGQLPLGLADLILGFRSHHLAVNPLRFSHVFTLPCLIYCFFIIVLQSGCGKLSDEGEFQPLAIRCDSDSAGLHKYSTISLGDIPE